VEHHKKEAEKMIITFFGHSEISSQEEVKRAVEKQILSSIKDAESVTFYLGGYGGFDGFALACVKKYKEENPSAKLVFVTCGADGCWYDNGTVSGHTAAPQGLRISDTTGAGDVFGGSALWKFLQINKKPEDLTTTDLHNITRFACAAASLSATRPGGISSVPDYNEVQKLIESI
jgi:fructokinase